MVNVPERGKLLAEMLALTAPGGAVALEDIDNVSWLCYPEHPSWTALLDAFHTAFQAGAGTRSSAEDFLACSMAPGSGMYAHASMPNSHKSVSTVARIFYPWSDRSARESSS